MSDRGEMTREEIREEIRSIAKQLRPLAALQVCLGKLPAAPIVGPSSKAREALRNCACAR